MNALAPCCVTMLRNGLKQCDRSQAPGSPLGQCKGHRPSSKLKDNSVFCTNSKISSMEREKMGLGVFPPALSWMQPGNQDAPKRNVLFQTMALAQLVHPCQGIFVLVLEFHWFLQAGVGFPTASQRQCRQSKAGLLQLKIIKLLLAVS